MALNLGWTNRLMSTQSAVRAAVADMERIAVAGISPSGSAGQPLTPFPTDQWGRLREGLREVVAEVDALVEDLAPAESHQNHQQQPPAVTRYLLSVALLMLEEQVIDDLDPRRIAGFGEPAPKDKERLIATTARLRERVAALREDVEHLSG